MTLFRFLACWACMLPFALSCQPAGAQGEAFPYALKAPNATLTLDDELEEVSGISFSPDYSRLCAIQDEDGILFFLDKNTGEIIDRKTFWDDGDYEDVAFEGPHRIWVVKSTGTLYEVNLNQPLQVTKHKSTLCKDNNIEGLAYEPGQHRLLLACKGEASNGEHPFSRAVYSFDIEGRKLSTTPSRIIRLKDIQAYLKAHKSPREIDEYFDNFFEEDRKELPFAPSGIALHPLTGDWYVISSKWRVLLVMRSNGTIKYMEDLDKDYHRQPEGIAFDRDGSLYIANESKDGDPPLIRVYDFRPNK